jgi:hypothetical protein
MRGRLQGEQAVVIEQVTECQEGCYAQARRRCVLHLAAGKGIEHPGGDGNLDALGECNDDTVRGLSLQPADNLDGLPVEGVVRVTNTGYRRMMSSVKMRSAIALRRICWKMAMTFAPCRNSWDTRTSAPPWSIRMCCSAVGSRCAARSIRRQPLPRAHGVALAQLDMIGSSLTRLPYRGYYARVLRRDIPVVPYTSPVRTGHTRRRRRKCGLLPFA